MWFADPSAVVEFVAGASGPEGSWAQPRRGACVRRVERVAVHFRGTGSVYGPGGGQEDETRILRDLFEGTGIMGAMDHARIEGANDPETRNIEAQASAVARRAAEALRQSRASRQSARPSLPSFPLSSFSPSLPFSLPYPHPPSLPY